MSRPDDLPNDELLALYHEASAQDTRRPADAVREAVLAHARMLHAPGGAQAGAQDAGKAAPANQSRWKLSLLASVALAALTGLLVLQFDRGTPEEQDAAYGQRSAPARAAPPTPAAVPPAALPSPASAAAPTAPARPQVQASPGATRSEAPERRAGTSSTPREVAPAQPGAAPSASARERAPEQVAPQAFPAAPAPAPAPAAPAPARSMAPPAPAAAADAAVRSAAPAQAQGKSASQSPSLSPSQESFALQAPRAQLAPGSPAMAMAIALHEAARTGRITQLDSLLRQGAPLNAPDDAGRTALALAVIHGQTAVVQRLLAAGANPALVDRDGLNALQHAQRLGLGQIASLIAAAS